ncbi:MAG: tyrosine-type recombinase/integrase [Actinobacteria bacterium]|nr:tyrosine-type recombinase/integrase [Actinomycetota bacterium]
MTDLRQALRDYLRIRRQLGFQLEASGRLLEDYVGFMERAGATQITSELALAKLPAGAQPHWWRRRLGMVRGFARYMSTIDPATEVPSKDLLPAHRPRIAPYIYSQAEIAALMGAARALRPPLRAGTCETLIGLMAASGLRAGEALGLDRAHVDLEGGALHVRAARQSKQREVPLDESTTRALSDYGRLRDRHWPRPKTPAFFISTQGLRLTSRSFNEMFSELIRQTGLEGRGERARPRPHDLRHTFAVDTLLGWYRAGLDVDQRLPLLSTYLGHVDPASTYWYLQAVPELLALASRRLDDVLGERS